jgi:peptidoglycan/LPS O-acetylase OafA/YrhL
MLGYYRLLAASGVVLAHANGGTDGMSRTMVGAFFVISGYLIGFTLSRNYGRNPLPFYWNRFLRLYPMHTFVALAVFLMAPSFASLRLGEITSQESLFSLLDSFTLTFGPNSGLLIAPAWTLSYEILFYLFAPLVFGFRWRGLPVGLILLIAISIGWLAVHDFLLLVLRPFALGYANPTAIYTSMLMFGFGGVLNELRNRIGSTPVDHKLEWGGALLLLSLVLLGSRYVASDMQAFDAKFGHIFTLGMYFSTALTLLGWTRCESALSKLAGDCTYPTYLIHWPILHAGLFHLPLMRQITDWFGHLFPLGHIFAVAVFALLISLLASYLLIRLDERFIRIFRVRVEPV